MNTTATLSTLSRRESEIAELIAWGMTKKEVAQKLFISERTVENTARHIYEKTGVTKSSELSAWWFCEQYGIPREFSPIKKTPKMKALYAGLYLAVCLLMLCMELSGPSLLSFAGYYSFVLMNLWNAGRYANKVVRSL